MKKSISIFMAILMVLSILPMGAFTSFALKIGDYEYEVISESDKTAKIRYYKGTEQNVIIPSEIDGYKVTEIRADAFLMCSSLADITIPDSVELIGERAFAHSNRLTSINVSENNDHYASIDGVLFNKNITEIIAVPAQKSGNYNIPHSVTTIGVESFAGCSNITNYNNGR